MEQPNTTVVSVNGMSPSQRLENPWTASDLADVPDQQPQDQAVEDREPQQEAASALPPVPGATTEVATSPGGGAAEAYERRFLERLERLLAPETATAPATAKPLATGLLSKSAPAELIGRLINLTRKLAELERDTGLYYRQADYALQLVLQPTPLLPAATLVLDDIDFATSRNSPIYVVMRGIVRSVLLLVTVFVSLVAGTGLVYVLQTGVGAGGPEARTLADFVKYLLTQIFPSPLFLAAVFGFLGSVVSLILRLAEFESATRRSRQFLLMTGLLLPIVGTICAAFACAVFHTGVITFAFVTQETPSYFYMVIGFLAGFSERFTRGLIGSVEGAVTVATRTQQRTVADAAGVMSTATTEERLHTHK